MSARQDKRARAAAMHEAKRRNLWGQGKANVFGKWWRRLLARISKRYAHKWDDAIGRWYKQTIKRWAKAVRASVHDQEWQAHLRAMAKTRRQEARKKAQSNPRHHVPAGA